MKQLHISTVRQMFAKKEPLDITIVTSKGELQTHRGVTPLADNFYGGYRNFKFPNGQIRKVRDMLIFAVNGIEVFI